MIESIQLRVLQGDPVVHDVHHAKLSPLFRGLPELHQEKCPDGCSKCADVCPTGAVQVSPLRIDIGLCVFCPECEKVCTEKAIHFTDDYHITCNKRDQLIITGKQTELRPEIASEKIKKYFGRSLKLRQISAGGCNGCELELNATSNVNFDMGRFGIEFVASPRHADGVVITGPITKTMAEATDLCYEAVPEPKIIILTGACAISGGIFKDSAEIDRNFLESHKIDLYIPGCPPHPLTFITGILDWLGRKA
ncbi:MAG: NADH:ubiquinone oxidoreductase [Bacteroidetes bacterium]|nr:NADH:ubiquinone oxidoreductase [Bacteroidota bacterium]